MTPDDRERVEIARTLVNDLRPWFLKYDSIAQSATMELIVRLADEIDGRTPFEETEEYFVVTYVGTEMLDCGRGKSAEARLYCRPQYSLGRFVLMSEDLVKQLARSVKEQKEAGFLIDPNEVAP